MQYQIPFVKSNFGEDEIKAATDAIKSGWLSHGPLVSEFESRLADFLGVKHAIACSSCTAALNVVVSALGLKINDRIIVPSLTYIATANAVVHNQLIPVLCDCDLQTYNISILDLQEKIGSKTKAIIVTDMNGMPCDYDNIISIANKHSFYTIADSAQSFGAMHNNKLVANQCLAHCFSLFANKTITTGEGGVVATNNNDLSEKIRILINQGQKKRYWHSDLGYNYRLTEIQAAIGICQLKKIDKLIFKRQEVAFNYYKLLNGLDGVIIPSTPKFVTRPSHFSFPLIFRNRGLRLRVECALNESGVETRRCFPPIHIQPIYRKLFNYKQSDFPNAYKIWRRKLDLPIWIDMNKSQQIYIANIIKKAICKIKPSS